MELISELCYPSNFFDPFGNEPTHSACDDCGLTYDNGDLNNAGTNWNPHWICAECENKVDTESNSNLGLR